MRDRAGGLRGATLAVGALTVIGVVLRLVLAGQSLFADELSTYYIVSTNGLAGVVSAIHGDIEITPPLFFMSSWLAAQIDLSPELLRAPSMIAGAAAIPLTYLLGARTVGREAGLLAAALTALSPFALLYSSEARGYALVIVLVLLSTLSMLAGVDDGRMRWWVAYGASMCAAVYTHYTAVYALAAQLVWVLWTHPRARRPALFASAGAAVAFVPWLSGLRNDFDSKTTDIVNSFNSVNLSTARDGLGRWAVGYAGQVGGPETGLRALPGDVALLLLAVAVAVALVALSVRWLRERHGGWPHSPHRRLVLIVALAVSVPACEAVVSTVGTDVFSARYFAVSWPALALTVAALLVAAGPRLRFLTGALAVVAFAIGAAHLLQPRFHRPDYQSAAAFIERTAAPGDVVLDGTGFSPAPPTGLDAALDRPVRRFYLGRDRIRYDDFKVIARAPPVRQVTRQTSAAAAGRRIFLVVSQTVFALKALPLGPFAAEVRVALPSGYRRVATRSYPGVLRLTVLVYASRATSRA